MKYVVFDTETGGLDPTFSAIISLGAVVWDSETGRQTDMEFYTVVNDEGDLDPDALRVNGFTRERITAEGVTPQAAFVAFALWCARTFPGKQTQLAGHNVGFDVGFLRRLARISGNGARYEALFSHRTLCTLNAVRLFSLTGHLRPGLGGLLQCCRELKIPNQEAHNALGDAKSAADLLTALIRLAKLPDIITDYGRCSTCGMVAHDHICAGVPL